MQIRGDRNRRARGDALPPPCSSHNQETASRRSSDGSSWTPHPSYPDDDERFRNPPTFVVGTCPDMCPATERVQRERLRDLSVFERVDGDATRTSPSLAVKKFCRTVSTAHVQASDIRPLPVLRETLDYLLKLLGSSEHPFELVHDFVFDRTRSIRQDLSMQNVINDQAAAMYEDMVKFHILSHGKLAKCCQRSDVSSLCYLNMEQLMKCLLSLFDMYALIRRSKSINKNEAVFCSFYVLLHLGYKVPKMGDSLSLWYRRLASPIQQSKEMRCARAILRCSELGNFKRLFCTILSQATDLQLCLVEPFLIEVRMRAIMYFNHSGYKLQPYPLTHLSEVLKIKESELEALCTECGLQTSMDGAGSKFLTPKQTSFCLPKSVFQTNILSSRQA